VEEKPMSDSKKNGFVFTEMRSTNAAKAREFYSRLMSWTYDEHKMGENTYTFIKDGGAIVGGFLNATSGPTEWLVFVGVDDCRAMTDKAREMGAKIECDCKPVGDMGIQTIIIDPQGARIAFWQEKKA